MRYINTITIGPGDWDKYQDHSFHFLHLSVIQMHIAMNAKSGKTYGKKTESDTGQGVCEAHV